MRNTFTLISSQQHNFIFGMFIVFSLKYLQMRIGDNNLVPQTIFDKKDWHYEISGEKSASFH